MSLTFYPDDFVSRTGGDLGIVISDNGPDSAFPIVVHFPYWNGYGYEPLELEYTVLGNRLTAGDVECITKATATQIKEAFRANPEYWLGQDFSAYRFHGEYEFVETAISSYYFDVLKTYCANKISVGLEAEDILKIVVSRREILNTIEQKLKLNNAP